MNPVIRIHFVIFGISLIYAIVRYPVFGGVDWIHLPLYIINKAFALTGFILLLISSVSSFFREKKSALFISFFNNRDLIGMGSFIFIIGHVFISLILMDPAYYDKFFNADLKMNLTGELSMIFGVIGLVFMWMTNRYFSFSRPENEARSKRYQFKKLIHWGVIASTVHITVMGLAGWLKPREWYGYLPPISLVAMACFIMWLTMMTAVKKTGKIN